MAPQIIQQVTMMYYFLLMYWHLIHERLTTIKRRLALIKSRYLQFQRNGNIDRPHPMREGGGGALAAPLPQVPSWAFSNSSFAGPLRPTK